ncbi:type IV secretory system conjugative DNA transfer family protein [Gulosibacter sediminis]|uniref:type IV secretory system conjugative DNA transfer family protein n=1 Tax=Gulosibacter sediminis TaxID=1729695 RepID=UPI0024A7B1C2|nr:TraM recognition domain-containing protein [Gulosibacter sediminis]
MRGLQGPSPFATLILWVALSGGAVAALSWVVVALVAGIACHSVPDGLWGGFSALITGDGALDAAACGGTTPVWAARIGVLVVAVAIVVAAVWTITAWARYRRSEKWLARDLGRRDGLASRREVQQHLGAKARLKSAGTVRPTLTSPTPEDVGVKIGESHGVPVYLSTEDSVVVEGAPRSGKGYRLLISAIIDWPGPLITTSTRNDNLAATMAMREQVGQVTVFDPQGLTGIDHSMRISPITGCQDPLVAQQRASAIMGGTALGSSTTNSEWAQEAEKIVAQLLLAAAVSGKDVTALRDWGAAAALARPAVEVLRSDGPAGWADTLEATLDADPKLLQSKWMGVETALAPLRMPSIARTMIPTKHDPLFDPDEFLAGRNTLYLVGTRSGAGASGGFLGAVLDDIVERARRKALTLPGSRLDPPLGLILDELANMFSWRALPTVLSDGGGIGIWTLVVLQALSQAETAWSPAEAETIWSSSIAKVLLGGASNIDHLRDVEGLLGTRKVRQTSRTSGSGMSTSFNDSFERLPVVSADELRRLPTGMGILAYKNRRGVLHDMPGWTERADVGEISAGKKRTEAQQAAAFARLAEAARGNSTE